MKSNLHSVAIATTLALSTLPMAAFAQTDIDPKMLTCTEFSSMSDEVKMEAVALMQQASNDASVNATAPLDVAIDATKRACLANPKVKAIEAMAMQ